ncbi:hypothetical protein FRB99_004617 [Tulasnella sp. 403]|nr:hypothetical protein FRB99_004617 [Tulasnella sp. 403]
MITVECKSVYGTVNHIRVCGSMQSAKRPNHYPIINKRDMDTPLAGPSNSKQTARRIVSALPKGKACLECRKRKVKCDALSPCNGCTRMRKECIYEEERERIIRLQGEVAKLEEKLKRLQAGPAAASNGTDRKGKQKSTSPLPDTDTRPPEARFTLTPPDAPDKEVDLTGDWWKLENPPPPIQKHLVEVFLETSRTGFTIHKPRFFKSLNLPPKYQPHPALLNAMYLIACHHSNDPLLTPHQDVFLKRVRASTLLAYYFLKSGRFLEAAYQISSAARFAIFCNLHKITTPKWRPPSTVKEDEFSIKLSGGTAQHPILPPPIDSIDVGERINLFWMIVLVDHSTSLITGLPSSIDYEDIETVWPRAIEDYEMGIADNDRGSVKSLFDPAEEHVASGDLSTLTLLRQNSAKSIVLLERAVKFSNSAQGLTPEEVQSQQFQRDFRFYFDAIERHLSEVPPLQIPIAASPTLVSLSTPDSAGFTLSPTPNAAGNPPAVPRFILVHTYGLVSYIHLYNAVCRGDEDGKELLEGYYQQRLEMAHRVLRDIRELANSGTDFRKHLMMQGFAWGVVAHVFAQHVRKLQKLLPEEDPHIAAAKQDLADVVNPIRILCRVFPILEFQLDRLRVYEIPIPES